MTSSLKAAPKAAQIDALVREYAEAQAIVNMHKDDLKAASETADEIKGRLIEMVKEFGGRHTEKSLRLTGLHSVATVTTAVRTTIDADAVESFRTYLGKQEIPDLAARFFSTHVSYSLVEGPAEVLTTLDLGARMRTKISSLLGLCFKVVTNAPSLKIELATSGKP